MNLRRINYHCSCGSCDECTGGNAKSYFEGMTQVPNIEQTVPIPGPAGKASLTVASVTDGTTDTAGTDVAIGGSTIADLTTLGFDVTTKPTLKVTPDPTDLNNTKVFIRESNGFLNFLASFKTKLLPSGSEGNILKYVSGLWTSAAPDWEKYNTTTTSPYVFSGASVGVSVPLTVGAGLSYRFKHVVAVVDPSDSDKYMEGIVESYSGTLLTIKIKNVKGTGNTTGYNVMLTAPEYLPYVNNPANYGKFFYNNNGVIEMRVSSLSTGFVFPWHNQSSPEGFVPCDGTPLAKTEFPALYEHLRPGGVPNKYAFALDGTTPLGIGSFRTPGYNNGTIPYGVASPTDLGVRYGANSYVLVGDNLPEVSPYPITGFSLVGNAFNASCNEGGGRNVFARDNGGGGGGAVTMPISGTITAGTNTSNGGTAIDMRQSSEGCFYIIKT